MNNFFLYNHKPNFDSQLHQQFKNVARLPDSALIHRITALELNSSLNEEFDPYAFAGCSNNLQFKKYDFSKSAPPESQWLHGKINRFQAEERLKTFNQPGCYLVRESDRLQTTFVLSYLDKKGSINHFQIKAYYGDYYIAGERFASLKHLIGYYTKYVDLLKNERLVYPVPPIEKSYKVKPKFVAIVPYNKMPDTDELSFCKGDIFEVHSCQEDWLWATNLRTNESGLVYIRTVKELKYINNVNEAYPWFIPNITKQEADDLLSKRGPGSFLVRPSDNSPGNYSLFFFVKNTVQRFRIERIGDSYLMGSRCFNSLEAVINLYKNEQIVAGYKLGEPVTRFDTGTTTSAHNLSIASNSSLTSTNMKSIFENSGSISSSTSTTAFSSSLSTNNSPLTCNSSFPSTNNILESGVGLDMEEIYATLCASREQCQKQRLQQKMTAFLFKKSKKKKKWKLRFFVLNPEDQTLNFYENDKKIRPKGIIDLSYSYLYIVHESLFGKPFCFQLVEKTLPCISTMHFICAADQDIYQSWIQALKPLCSSKQLLIQQPKPLAMLHSDRKSINQQSPNEFAVQIRTLYLTLFEARRLPVKIAPQPFFLICLNKNKIARTSVKCPPDPIYEQEFVLEDIPGDITNFSISLFNKGKHSKDAEIAEFIIELASLNSGEEIEEWFNLNNISIPGGGISGSVRLRIRFVSELVMPFEKYQRFKKLIMDDDLEVISLLEEFSSKDRSLLSNSLLKVFIYEDKEAQFLSRMIEREVKKEAETCTLFRSNSLTTNLMDKYMKEICGGFINKALKESLVKIMENKHSCELNPQRLPRFEEACANAIHLLSLLDEVIDRIFASVEHCPKNLRYICHCLQRSVMAKWPNDQLIRTQAVGSFIFLRLICPAILYPRQFNLINDIPSENASRSLILIAKSLQNLSNLIEFGNKEAWMEVVNPFILKNKSRMIKFIDDLASIPEPDDQSEEKSQMNEPARELAAIHSLCEQHQEKIFNLSQTCPTLKTLTAVCQKLTEQKKRYSDVN